MILVLIMMLLQFASFNGKAWSDMNKMFGFMKKIFFTEMNFFSCSALKCVSINNQECKITPEIVNINSNESSFYPYSILLNKCSGSCNNINDPYPKL